MKSTLIETKNKTTKFKFVFDDATDSRVEAFDFREAAILALSNRIRNKKSKKIIGMWSQDESGGWNHVVQDSITYSLR